MMPLFDGETFVPSLDAQRLGTQLDRVRLLMADGQWRTLAQIRDVVGGSEASVSARLRDMRKQKWGAWRVEGKRKKDGLWIYRAEVGQ